MVEELKIEYNYILNRYYNGCNYVEANPNEFNKYIGEIMGLKSELESILSTIQSKQNVSEEEILGGFKIC